MAQAPDPVSFEPGPFTPFPRFPGTAIVAAMRAFAAAQPWRATAHALTLVGSHDTRGSDAAWAIRDLVTVAFGLLATMPGIPMLWAGDEIGQEGVNGEDGRRPFPWHDTGQLGHRPAGHQPGPVRSSRRQRGPAPRRAALAGGRRRLLTFLREAPERAVLVHAARADHTPVRLPASLVGRTSRVWPGPRTSTPTPTAPSPCPPAGQPSACGAARGRDNPARQDRDAHAWMALRNLRGQPGQVAGRDAVGEPCDGLGLPLPDARWDVLQPQAQ